LLNADCAALIFSGFGGAIFHFKPSIFQKARLERAQTRRKTGANSRKRAQIKKGTTCVFKSALFQF
jgi:hypothetical protein